MYSIIVVFVIFTVMNNRGASNVLANDDGGYPKWPSRDDTDPHQSRSEQSRILRSGRWIVHSCASSRESLPRPHDWPTTTRGLRSRLEKSRLPCDLSCPVSWPSTPCPRAPRLWPSTPAVSKRWTLFAQINNGLFRATQFPHESDILKL